LHRDIKSQNVFVRDIGSLEVCLGDFGLAKQTMRKTVMNQTTAGTPLYLAPEQMRNEPYNDKADIWSLGVLFYEMAALDYPFMADSALALARVVVDQKHKPLTGGYSTLLRDLIESMLEKQPANRPTMFQLFNSEFFFTV
jgi:NIMA (never in mitosis gene a)-related kinase